ncbi:peptidoglycan DD-metalloendopeptidase family protein [bacterium]|nr:peptidoglycan DD-metalloendopeptidase family protein [bacterium]
MPDKKIKFMLFSFRDSEFKTYDLSIKTVCMLFALLFVGMFILATFFFSLFTKALHNYKLANLQRENIILVSQLSSMQQKLNKIKLKLQELEKLDDDLRIIADLPQLDSDIRDVGTGGAVERVDYVLNELPIEVSKKAKAVHSDLDRLERLILLEHQSFREIQKKIQTNKNLLMHTPSIRPVLVGRLKSKFGYRIDPFLGVIKHHNGIDLAARIGTPVYATADGVVEVAQRKFQRNKGYGLHVIINHGNGIKTVYAHLSRIYVKTGQRVKRWDKIGEVGKTGRATGSHLHYEVRVNNKPVDPLTFIYNW